MHVAYRPTLCSSGTIGVMRLVLFYVLLLVAQGVVVILVAPLPAPDFFLLAVLSLLWRLPAWQLVIAGYGIGLLQDLMGYGELGFHALSLAGAALCASFVKAQLSQTGFFERVWLVVAALVGKWLVIIGLLLWLTRTGNPLLTISRVAPVEALFTLLLAMWLLPLAERLMEKSSLLRKELL